MPTETLNCTVGNHPWEREVTRGAKPKYCPDHLWVKLGLPDPQTGSPAPVEASAEEPVEKVVNHPQRLKQEAAELLASSRVGDEMKRKLRYCYDKFEAGRGHGGLLSTYQSMIKTAQRGFR